jgi:hypothetical protein
MILSVEDYPGQISRGFDFSVNRVSALEYSFGNAQDRMTRLYPGNIQDEQWIFSGGFFPGFDGCNPGVDLFAGAIPGVAFVMFGTQVE